jgi:sugar/nucleoside kinase (ribokinase family)
MVHLGPIADEDTPEIAQAFPNATVLATLQGWMRQWSDEGVVRFKPLRNEQLLNDIDIAVFSEEDIGRARDEETWISSRARHTFVTRAERGGSYYHDGVEDSYTTPEVTVVEPTGAGDVFAASLLSALPLVSFDMRQATRIAAVLAANSVTRPALLGTPTREEVQLALTGELKVQDGSRD